MSTQRQTSVPQRLEAIRAEYGKGLAARKLAMLRRLSNTTLPDAGSVLRLHEILCFLRAYPDDTAVRRQVDRMLARFDERADLQACAAELADSGIAGTEIHYRFYATMAMWLATRWPDALDLDWDQIGRRHPRLAKLLPLLATYAESPALDTWALSLRKWIDRLRGEHTAGTFVVRRLLAQRLAPPVQEAWIDGLNLPFVLRPGPDTPARGRELHPAAIVYQRRALRRGRPDLREAAQTPPRSIRAVSLREGRELIALTRSAMVTRARDLEIFGHADARDVRLVDCSEGLQFAAIGVLPERRQLFEAVYGFLTLHNGVPIGYVLNSALFGSAEIAFNVFETFRGAEAAWIYGRLVGTLRKMFGVDTLTVYPYQLGEDNKEALESGAWWFYQKLGFRPRKANVVELMNDELRRMRRRPEHRSSIATLRRLATANVYLDLGERRSDVIGELPIGMIGIRLVDYLAQRFGADRERAVVCAAEAAARLGFASVPARGEAELCAWRDWGPLVCLLPGVDAWSDADKKALAAVVRAKGGRRESEFVRKFDRHAPLRTALLRLGAGKWPKKPAPLEESGEPTAG